MMPPLDTAWHARLDADGFVLLPGVFPRHEIDAVRSDLERSLDQDRDGFTMRGEDGSVFGARNLFRLWPAATEVWRRPPLPDILATVLGPGFGLVRGLYFDKPPTHSWALPWHKDMTIAVRDNRLPSVRFEKPTRKAGVPHVEAPREVLERMLTLRLHLNDVTAENGPLQVIPGSHLSGKESVTGGRQIVTILANAGDVLLMRPLVSHCSNTSGPGSRRHRRVLHLEFAGIAELPDGYAWHEFIPGAA